MALGPRDFQNQPEPMRAILETGGPRTIRLWQPTEREDLMLRLRRSATLIGLLCASVLLLSGAPVQALDDDTPPTFAGLQSAYTCIPGPGPVKGERTSYHLMWEAATDDVTPSSQIVYLIYRATTRGGENFSRPTYRTAPGVTSFETPKLLATKTFYFVVRARDRAGNIDSNAVEREGQNLCE
jgi:hypothetical protein